MHVQSSTDAAASTLAARGRTESFLSAGEAAKLASPGAAKAMIATRMVDGD